jgi:GNAT superfamily N-acetyltransferase
MSIRRPAAHMTIADGTVVDLRPVHPDDKPLLLEGFERMSPRARFLRFLSPTERLTARQLSYLSEIDHHDHVAWGVLRQGEPIAVARFIRLCDQPTEADVAVTVVDARQRSGVGRLLLQVLGVSARARGIGVFHFDVLGENRAMLGLLESLGGHRLSEGEVVHAVLPTAAIRPPENIEGDLTALLDVARREAQTTFGFSSRDRAPATPS